MDIPSIIGLIFGFGGLLGAFIMEKGDPLTLIQPSAALIVVGGTVAALLITFPASELKLSFKYLMMVFFDQKLDRDEIVQQLVQLSNKGRREGIISLEQNVQSITNPLLKRGLALVIDGVEGEVIREILDREIYLQEQECKAGAEIFEAGGGYSPTFGIIGTVLGLISVLGNLSEPDKLGGHIAIAFVATFYGVCFANLIWLNFGKKIKVKGKHQTIINEMILEGLLSLQSGENPRILVERIGNPEDSKATGDAPQPAKAAAV